jgi:orotate phosphoribosyltransferase
MTKMNIVFCYDLDGVLCADPPMPPGNKAYIDFLDGVEMIQTTNNEHAEIVTGRTEQYRTITEQWLKRHNIMYNKLIMKPNNLAGVKNTPKFKADYYINSNACLFIESCPKQAKEIADLSKKPVYCYTTKNMIK